MKISVNNLLKNNPSLRDMADVMLFIDQYSELEGLLYDSDTSKTNEQKLLEFVNDLHRSIIEVEDSDIDDFKVPLINIKEYIIKFKRDNNFYA